jgi:sRNA-binding carbon storage regulator CsrA
VTEKRRTNLVLTRRVDESVLLICPGGIAIRVTVDRINKLGDSPRVRLKFNSPEDVRITRETKL